MLIYAYSHENFETIKRVYDTLLHSWTPEKYTESDKPYIIVHKPRKAQLERAQRELEQKAAEEAVAAS